MSTLNGDSLPCGWANSSIEDVVIDRVEQAPPREGSAVRYIDITGIDRATKRIAESREVCGSDAPTRARQWVRAGDVLVSMTRPNLNAVAQVPASLDGAVSSTGFDVLRSSGIASAWLFYRVQSEEFISDLTGKTQGVVYPAVRPRDVRAHRLPVPPLPEQERIIAVIETELTRLDAAVAALERVRANLKRYRASVLKAAVEGRLVPTEADLARKEGRDFEPASMLLERILAERRGRWEESDLARMNAAGKPPKDDHWKSKYKEPIAPDTSTLPQLPDGWCWATVDQLISEPLSNGRSVQTDPEGFPVLRLTALKENAIDLSERKGGAWTAEAANPFLVAKGDFFVARGNGSIRLVGWGGLVDCEPDPVAFPDTLIRVRLAKGSVLAKLLAHVWNSRWIRDQIEHKAKTTAGIHKVNQTDLSRCVLPVLPMQEQQRVLSELERMTSIALIADQAVAAAEARCYRLRQSILKWAFEGRLVDQDPNDEPASVLLERIRAERPATPSRKSRKSNNHQTEAAK